MKQKIPIIGITIGDPAGIGPEVTVRALGQVKNIYTLSYPLVIGTHEILTRYVPKKRLNIIGDINRHNFVRDKINLYQIPAPSSINIVPGKVQASAGRLAIKYIRTAVDFIRDKKIDAVVTAPVSKESIQQAGYKDFIGHTEYLAKLTGTPVSQVTMCMLTRDVTNQWLRIVQVTRHVSIAQVPKLITPSLIRTTIRQGVDAILKFWHNPRPRVAVCGLNPHAGESGLFGREEKTVIAPVINQFRRMGYAIEGPLPADSVFQPEKRKLYDLIVVQYHDQVMIAVKSINPTSIVNLTLGIPFIRTSPGHGTAFDIAGKKLADPRPMTAAVKLALELINEQWKGIIG